MKYVFGVNHVDNCLNQHKLLPFSTTPDCCNEYFILLNLKVMFFTAFSFE